MENELLMKELTETTARSKSNTKRIDAMERRQDNLEILTKSVAVMQTKQEQIEADVTEIKTDVKDLKANPGKRWELVVVGVISVLVGYVVNLLLSGG